jgi:antagonist of KipI
MSEIHVLAPGLLTTVQDLGREGFGPMGVSPSGAADSIALRIGNRLVGNAEGAAGLEMTLLGGTFLFPQGAVVALTGSDFGATLDGAPVVLWSSFEGKPGQTLKMGPTRTGARCYLCVRGGIEVKPFLGSASTHLLSGLGGHEGRALRKGDVLKIGAASGTLRKRMVAEDALKSSSPRKVLSVTPGPQSDWFPEAAQKLFYASTYRVAEESNRMGLRLEGPAIRGGAHEDASRKAPGDASGRVRGEMVSEGVALGAVQIAAGGLPIILFVEQQTTGGYPKIANVISADLHSLGQLRPRDEIQFERVDWETARSLLIEQEKLLASEDLIVEDPWSDAVH